MRQSRLQAEIARLPVDLPLLQLGALLRRQRHAELARRLALRPMDEDCLSMLFDLAEDEAMEVRRWAVTLLGRGAHLPRVAARIRTAATDPEPSVRRVAWERLIRAPAPREWLDASEEPDPRLASSWIRARAAALAGSHHQALLDEAEALSTRAWPDTVALATAFAVAAVVSPGTLTPRLRHLRALGHLPAGVGRRAARLTPEITGRVAPALRSTDPAERLAAAQILRQLDLSEALTAAESRGIARTLLEELGPSEPVPAVRWAMREALRRGWRGDPSLPSWLWSGFDHVHTRRVFRGALFAEIPTLPELDRVLRCLDPQLRSLAAMVAQTREVLGEQGALDRARLIFLARDPSRAVRRTVAPVLSG